MNLAIPLFLLVWISSCALAQEKQPSSLKNLRAGEVEVETLLPQGPAEAVAILKKYVTALHKNSEWWHKYAREHQSRWPGPRPYHANMGITLDEYDALVAARDSWGWSGKEKGTLQLVQTGDSKLRIIGEGKFQVWDGLEFDPANDTVHYGNKTLTRQPHTPNHLGLGPLGNLLISAWHFEKHDSVLNFRILKKTEDDTAPLLEVRRAIILDGSIISSQASIIRLQLF